MLTEVHLGMAGRPPSHFDWTASHLQNTIMQQTLLDHLKAELRARLAPSDYDVWIEPLTDQSNGREGLVVGCPNAFARNWVARHFTAEIREVLGRLGHRETSLSFEIGPRAARAKVSDEEIAAQPNQLELPYEPGRVLNRTNGFNPAFTFENFITGPSNIFAHQAALALSQRQGLGQDALFIQADTGLGKSHLSQAVGLALAGGSPHPRVMYLSAEEFTNQMIAAIRSGQIESFKTRFRRSCEALILEEVQFLSGKEKTQAELGYTLDSLMGDGKPVVLSGSRLPNQIPGLRRELASRLEAGVVAKISPPDHETRVRIIHAKADLMGIELPSGVAELLADGVKRDIRRLESILMNVAARAELLGRPLSVDLARETLGLNGSGGRPGQELIIDLVCGSYKVSPEDLSSKSRLKRIAEPRSLVCYLCRRYTDLSLAEIGRLINRKHTTVLYAVDRIEQARGRRNRLGREAEFLARRLEERF